MAIFKKEYQFHDDSSVQRKELVQLELPEFYSLALDNEDCDKLSNARGVFGRFYKNPIITNGDFGTMIYLGKLINENTRSFILFHKLGSIPNRLTNVGEIDIFEIVDETGEQWEIFFIDRYHPRRSNLTPDGYHFLSYNKELGDENLALGTLSYSKNFPFNLVSSLIADHNQRYKTVEEIVKKMVKAKIERPETHANKLKSIESILLNEQ